MPTTRRKQATSANASQRTLSFNSKTAKVTKPTANDSFSGKKPNSKLSEPAEEQAVEAVSIPEPESPQSKQQPKDTQEEPSEKPAQVVLQESPQKAKPRNKKAVVSKAKDGRESAAEKVTDAQLKKYWKAEEDSRLAPRVHQTTVPLHEKILRHFDLSSQYGPCIGIARLTRWKRANMLGLEPPIEVLAVLLREEDKKSSQGCGKMAYIDELSTGGGRGLLVE